MYKATTGKTQLEHLNELKVLDNDTVVVHANVLSEQEEEILRYSKTQVIFDCICLREILCLFFNCRHHFKSIHFCFNISPQKQRQSTNICYKILCWHQNNLCYSLIIETRNKLLDTNMYNTMYKNLFAALNYNFAINKIHLLNFAEYIFVHLLKSSTLYNMRKQFCIK